jgi:hypothetical protein
MAVDLLAREWFDSDVEGHEDLWRRFDQIKSQSQLRLNLDRFYCSLYYDRAYQGFNAGDNLAELFVEGMRDRLNENVIARIVQTLSAKFAKQKPKPTVLTDGADWGLQQRAKKYDKYIWGVLHKAKVYELQRASDLHMLIAGTGAIHCTSRNGSVYCETVPPWELFVDTNEGRYGSPRTLYRRQYIDRRLLAKLYPKQSEAILAATSIAFGDAFSATGNPNSDMIAVVTGWRLPSGPNSEDGRVVVAIDDATLSSGAWTRERFPFAFSRYSLAPEGFWGIGVVAQLVGMQLELNRTLTFRQEALRLLSAPFIAIESGSKIVKSHLSNAIGRIIEYTGTPPTVVTPSAISPESFTHSDRVKSGMFSQSGISELAATSMKPAGLNSGKAIRAYADMQDDGLHDALVRREQQVLDLAELILDEAEDLAENDEADTSAVYVGPFGTETINFDEAKLDRDAFVLRVQPTSSLSMTLSGRLEDLQDLRDLGIVTDPAEMQELLQLPDLETAAARRNSMRDLLLEVLEVRMLGDGVAVTPEPTWDLALALKLCVQTRLRAQLRNAPEDRLELLRVFEEQCIFYQQPAAPPGPPPAPTAPVVGPEQPTIPQIPPELGAEQLPPEMVSPNAGGQPVAA